MGTVKQRRTKEAVRSVLVGGLYNKILVVIPSRSVDLGAAGVLEARKAICYLEIQGAHPSHRTFDVFHQLHLQGVINRTPNRLQEVRCSLGGVLAGKGARHPQG